MNIASYSDICKTDSTLRPYQQKAKKEIFESWDEVDNVMFQMPTGTGKTRLFTSIISDINKFSIQRREAVKILIVAHRTELIYQIDKHLDKYKVPHNIIVGGKEKNYKYPVSVASIQTITNAHNIKKAQKLKVQFIIIDEAHHALAASYKKLWDMYPDAKRLGVTATPWRMNHQSFLDLFNKLVMSMPIKDFIKQGYLAPYKYFSLRDDSYIQKTIDDLELDKFGEYKESSMEEKMDIGSIRAQLLKSYLSLAEGKKGIIYAINIAHARHICKEYENAGYKVVCIDSKTSDADRKDYVDKFKKNQIDIIVNVDIFSEGFDCPDIEFIQLARPTCSLVKYLQQVGRGLRPTENKQNCVILDNVGMYSKFGLPDARRHWNYHFKGKKVDEEPAKYISNGTGKSRYVDMSEGTEDMELIQDVSDIVETNPVEVSSAINDFFPLFGITLGKTTWKEAKEMGYKVNKWEMGPSRTMNVEEVDFWDHDGDGVFTSLYWTKDESDFPSLWKSKGFDWILSYEKWIDVFEKLGFTITVTRQPSQSTYSRRKSLSAEFEALSPDKTLCFILDFNCGECGYSTSSPKTLYSISLNYQGMLTENQEEETVEDVLVEDVNDDNEVKTTNDDNSSINNDFFPLFGVTLGKTTWKQVEDMGYEVKIWEKGPDRLCKVEGVAFWDHKGKGVFTSFYWTRDDSDFPPLWKSKGFSWDISYDEWIQVFENLGFKLTVTKQPIQSEFSGHKTLSAEFEAVSPDKLLEFTMEFDYGENGYLTSSPKTLEGLFVSYNVIPKDEHEDKQNEDEIATEEPFDPMPLLQANNYQDDYFVFWSEEEKKTYEAYIHDDKYFIISELIIDQKKHCVHRKRVGKISAGSWMFSQMERREVESLKSVAHYGASFTVFHYQVINDDGTTKNLYFDYKGREIVSPAEVKDKYEKAISVGKVSNYIDVPLSIATFSSKLKSGKITVFRTLKAETKPIAHFSVVSDFGNHYYYDSEFLKELRKKTGTKRLGDHNIDNYLIYRSDDHSFTVRSMVDNIGYLYQYDLKGELIKKDIIASYETSDTNLLSDSDIDKLWHVFDSKATSYKYFWFLSILQFYNEHNQSSTIPFKDIVAKMIANAWQYVFNENCVFPEIDQIPKYIDVLLAHFMLEDHTEKSVVENRILYYYERSQLDHKLSPLLKNVPYRFLSPWIPFTSNNDVIAKSNEKEARCLYSIHDDYIQINPIWSDYLTKNYDKIEAFIEEELLAYLKCEKVIPAMTINEFTKRCRELQGKFREKMGEPMGYVLGTIPPKKNISMLFHGEKTGKNFVNKFAFDYAKRRVEHLQPHETINEYRLFNNMLSSQPMAFNLFCPFIKMLQEGKVEAVTRIFKAIFPDKFIGKVTEVGLEYLHTDIKNYLNDCTAMDAIVRYKDAWGKPAFIAIETKYTDVLGDNTSSKDRAQDKYREWIKRIGMFKPETEAKLLSGKKMVTQIYRNFLLTECYGIVEKANRCYSVVLAPAQHPTTEKEVTSLKNELKYEYRDKITSVSLEHFIKKALNKCPREDRAAFEYFKERYLNI